MFELLHKSHSVIVCLQLVSISINEFIDDILESLYILTSITNIENSLYTPYCLYSPHLYKERKYNNINRKYLLAYCNTNKIPERENIFDTFVEKTMNDSCHALSSCHGKYHETQKQIVGGNWSDENLIDTYKDYTFVIAMENTCVDGYITEKILNAFYSGSIPIYWGSSNINDFFNHKAFINVSNFNSYEDCVDYVINMSKEQINNMINEPIYNNNELINLLNDNYNSKNNNTILNKYIQTLKSFIE